MPNDIHRYFLHFNANVNGENIGGSRSGNADDAMNACYNDGNCQFTVVLK